MRGKRYQQLRKEIDRTKNYDLKEALELIKKCSKARFDESIEIHLRLGINPKKGDQQVRSTVVLPYNFGKSKKVAAFVEPTQEQAAKEAGADIVGGQDLVEKIAKSGKIDFDLAVATPPMMKSLAKIAKILGPRGLMPSPKNDTVTTNLTQTIGELKKGKVAFKNDNTGNIHQIIGKTSMEANKLLENIQALRKAVLAVKPPTSKGIFIKSVTLCSTMGPGVKIINT